MTGLDPKDRSAAIAAGVFLLVFGLGFFLLPKVMLYLGDISPYLAALVGLLFVLAFFLVLWLRARHQRIAAASALERGAEKGNAEQ